MFLCSGNFDLEGLDATWNGSSGDEKDDCAMESDDRDEEENDDEDDIPQLDGASDEKTSKSFLFLFVSSLTNELLTEKNCCFAHRSWHTKNRNSFSSVQFNYIICIGFFLCTKKNIVSLL